MVITLAGDAGAAGLLGLVGELVSRILFLTGDSKELSGMYAGLENSQLMLAMGKSKKAMVGRQKVQSGITYVYAHETCNTWLQIECLGKRLVDNYVNNLSNKTAHTKKNITINIT